VSSRTIEHGGTWWAQTSDGTWRRWSHVFGDWEAAEGPPAGLFPVGGDGPEPVPVLSRAQEVMALDRGALDESARGWPSDYLGTLFRLALPGLLLGLVLPLAFLLSLRFLFLSQGGLLPPPDNVKAIFVWSVVAGAFVAASMVGLRRLGGDDRRLGRPAQRAVAGAMVASGLLFGWLATGSQWSGSTTSKGLTLAVILLLGLAIEALHGRGAFAWLRATPSSGGSAYIGPG
jgi:hypothetical protein